MKKIHLPLGALLALSIFTACGNNEPAATTETTTETTTTTEPAVKEVTLNVTGDDQMKFNTTELRVKPGQQVTIILKNIGKLPKESMGHNLVILQPYTDIEDFSKKAQSAGLDKDYIPESEAEKIVIHTKLLGAGESDTITFTAPDEGEYDFICSFPGHHMSMKGKFIVAP